MQAQGEINLAGALAIQHNKTGLRPAPLAWRLRQKLSLSYIQGAVNVAAAKKFSALTGIPTMTGELRGVYHSKDGRNIDMGVLSRKVITTAFVNFIVDQLQVETAVFGDFKYHDSGVGITAEAVGDTAMETTDGEARVAGTQTETSAPVYSSVGTIAYTTTKAITEHGLFNDLTAGTLMDRSKFTAWNVVSGDSIQFSYSLTVNSGG